jgi:hypothetical protein
VSAKAILSARPTSRTWLVLEAILLVIIMGLALAPRIHDLEGHRSSFPDLYDEGIEAQELLLMAKGFGPREINDPHGTLKLVVLYPLYALFGGTLGAGRLAVALFSLVGLLGIWWTARQAAGAFGGLVAAALLSMSAVYLEASRLLLADVPSLAPCIWAIGCGLRWQRGGSPVWLYAAVVLATIGVLIKLAALPVMASLALLLLLRRRLELGHVAVAVALALGISTVSVLAMGPAEVYQEVVVFSARGRQTGRWDLEHNFKKALAEPFRAQPGLFILAAGGALLLIGANWRSGLALAAWPLATAAVLLSHHPLHPKHLVYLYPPLALVAGAGLGRAAWLAWKNSATGRPSRLATVGLAAALAAVPLGPLPAAVDSSSRIETEDADLNVFDQDAAQSLGLLSGPRDFVLTDHPYIAVLAERMTPPKLDGVSVAMIRRGLLTDRDVINMAEQYDTRVVLAWSDRLRRLPGIPPWLESNYTLVQSFGNRNVKTPRGAKDRSIYLRRDVDPMEARRLLGGTLSVHESADFEDKLRILGAGVSTNRVAPREQFTLTVGWLSLAPMSTDYHSIIQLVAPDGAIYHQQEHDLEGSQRGTSGWPPGRWLFRSYAVQPEANSPAGDYRLLISLVDPKSGQVLRPVPAPDAAHFRDERGALTVATISIY